MSKLSSRLDDIARELKRSALHEFMFAERALQTQHRAALAAQQEKADALAAQLQAEIQRLTAENAALSRSVDGKRQQFKDTVVVLQRSRSCTRSRYALRASMHAWRTAVESAKALRLNHFLTNRLYSTRLLCLCASSWRRQVQLHSKERIVAHERAASDMARSKLFEDIEVERSEMSSENARLAHRLAEETKQRTALQENLRRVFMRGVCALNFEAMTLLNDGTSLEGPSPPLPAPADFNWGDFENQVTAMSSVNPTSSSPGPPPGSRDPVDFARHSLTPPATAPCPTAQPAESLTSCRVQDGGLHDGQFDQETDRGDWHGAPGSLPKVEDSRLLDSKPATSTLPFVSYTAPPVSSQPSRGSQVRSLPKGQRWQPASALRSSLGPLASRA